MLGIRPVLGRDFLAEENTGRGAHVAILSYGIWQTQMAGDREIIGRTITLDGEPFTVIGVMPPGLEGSVDPVLPGDTDVWTPLALVGQTAGSGENIEVLGRLTARAIAGTSPSTDGEHYHYIWQVISSRA